MKIKPLNWRKEASSWHAEGASCNYSVHPEHKRVRLFIVNRNKRPEVLDFDTYQGAMAYAQKDTQKRVRAWLETLDTADSIHQWFVAAKPKPTKKDTLTQIGAMFEEMSEILRAFGIRNVELEALSKRAYEAKWYTDILERPIDEVELLDALCDTQVTMQGVAYMFDLDYQGALAEVNRSNWSKFENGKPLLNENGKIIKGANYTAPQLEEFV